MKLSFSKPKFFKRLIAVFLVFVLVAFVEGDNRSVYHVPLIASSICSNDFDQDGDIDIAVGHLYNWNTLWSGISTLTNDGLAMMTCDSFYMYENHWDVVTAQLNNNTQFDLITQLSDEQNLMIGIVFDFMDNQNNILSIPIIDYAETYAIGDLDSNSSNDVVFISHDGLFWGVLYNDGYGNFTAPEYHFVDDYYPNDIACCDLNDDGRDDVVVCGQSTEVYFSYPDGFEVIQLETNDYKSDVFIDDLDHDGDNDIVTFSGNAGYTIIVMYNNLSYNTFERIDNFTLPQITHKYCVEDFNNDSLPDILFHLGDYSGFIIYYNLSNFQFSHPLSVPNSGNIVQSTCDDFDNNGYKDIASAFASNNPQNSVVKILFNDGDNGFVENPIVDISENGIAKSNFICYPNPFSTSANIQFTLKETALVELSIFNLQGRHITGLLNKTIPCGKHNITWDGLDDNNNRCENGTYLLILRIDNKHKHLKKIIFNH